MPVTWTMTSQEWLTNKIEHPTRVHKIQPTPWRNAPLLPIASTVLDHALSPRNGGAMEAPDAVGKSSLAGRPPYVTIFLRIAGQNVAKAQFQTFGCGYSIACCSVLTELAAGRSISDCHLIGRQSVL